LLDIFN